MSREQLVVPKHHGTRLTDIPDDALEELLVRSCLLYRACQCGAIGTANADDGLGVACGEEAGPGDGS